MSPPIYTPDGSEVSEIVLPDGSTASQVIGPDGNVVFEAGPDIPDTSLDHLWWGPSMSDIATYPDEEGALDLSEVGNAALSDINGEQSVSYDGTDDGHKADSVPAFGSGDVWTAAVVIDPADTGNTVVTLSLGTDADRTFGGYTIRIKWDQPEYNVAHSGIQSVGGGTPSTGAQVIVATYDGSNAIMDVNGSEVLNGPISAPDSPQPETAIGQRGDGIDPAQAIIGAAGHEAAAADAARRDELTNKLGDYFGISVST